MKLFLKISIIRQTLNVDEVNNQYHEELFKKSKIENIVENTSHENDEKSFAQEAVDTSQRLKKIILNDLKEFGVDTDEPDLFSS